MRKKINQHREYSAKLLNSRLSLVRSIHDDELFFNTKLGKDLVTLKNLNNDIKHNNSTIFLRQASKHTSIKQDMEDHVSDLVREIDFISAVAIAIRDENHKCKHFNYFMENFHDYIKYLDESNLSIKLKKYESALRTLQHKEIIEQLHNTSHKKDFKNQLVKKFGEDATGPALYHYIQETLNSSKDPNKIAKQLESRAYWLNVAAKLKSRYIIASKIREINTKRKYWIKKTSKLLDQGLTNNNFLEEMYHEFN